MTQYSSAALAVPAEAPAVTMAIPDREPPADGTSFTGPVLPRVPLQPRSTDGESAPKLAGATILEFPLEKAAEPPPDITRWAGALIVATFEALHGVRATGQLRRWYDPRVHAAVAARAARARPPAVPPRVSLRSVRASHVADDRVEANGVVEIAGRCRAVALQMQTYDGRWRVTALEIG